MNVSGSRPFRHIFYFLGICLDSFRGDDMTKKQDLGLEKRTFRGLQLEPGLVQAVEYLIQSMDVCFEIRAEYDNIIQVYQQGIPL